MKNNLTNRLDDDNYFDQLDQSDFAKLSYDEQIKLKQVHVEQVYQEKGIVTPVQPVIKAQSPMHYRHKVTTTATNIKEHGKAQIKLGFYIENTHKIKPVFESVVQDKSIENTLKDIEQILQKNHFTAYVKGHDRGIIKHILIRKSYSNQDLLVVFVTQGYVFPNSKRIIQAIREKNPHIKSVVQVIQKTDTPIVLYGEDKVLYGPGYIEDKIHDLRFKLSAKSFYQVNPKQMITLYDKAFEMANIKKNEQVMDCYSGIGTLSLLAAQKAASVIAIEVNASAVGDAKENAKRNQISNVTFIKDDVEKYMDQYQGTIDVLLMDPPRTGASLSFVESVKRLKPKRILYISCFPETQARDIKQFMSLYEIKDIQPVDMFPYTSHIECIAYLERKLK